MGGLFFGVPKIYDVRESESKIARLSSLNMVCPKQGPNIKGDVLLMVGILGIFLS